MHIAAIAAPAATANTTVSVSIVPAAVSAVSVITDDPWNYLPMKSHHWKVWWQSICIVMICNFGLQVTVLQCILPDCGVDGILLQCFSFTSYSSVMSKFSVFMTFPV